MLAGSNLSGDLSTPTQSIARGTLSSLVFVTTCYAAIILALAGSVSRTVLQTNLHVMDTVVWANLRIPLGQIGITCTTVSSALSYLLGAPRVLHAVAKDAKWRWLLTDAATDALLVAPLPPVAPSPPPTSQSQSSAADGVSSTATAEVSSGRQHAPSQLSAPPCDASRAPGQPIARKNRRSPSKEPLRCLLLTWALVQFILLTGTVDLLAPLVMLRPPLAASRHLLCLFCPAFTHFAQSPPTRQPRCAW